MIMNMIMNMKEFFKENQEVVSEEAIKKTKRKESESGKKEEKTKREETESTEKKERKKREEGLVEKEEGEKRGESAEKTEEIKSKEKPVVAKVKEIGENRYEISVKFLEQETLERIEPQRIKLDEDEPAQEIMVTKDLTYANPSGKSFNFKDLLPPSCLFC